MLPSMIFNMEDQSNNLNNNVGFGLPFEESVILNGVRSRKKNIELPNCPVCSCTIRNGELESHLNLEIERLTKLSCGSKRKLSQTTSSNILAMPGPSDSMEDDVQVLDGTGSEVFQRVHTNRISRLRSRTRRGSPEASNFGECPVCEAKLPMSKLHRHAVRCLKRTGASVDDDIPDSSDEDIDVENDDVSTSNTTTGFGAEYDWCGQSRIRATALQEGGTPGTSVRRASHDTALVVDDDEDTELYGPPQYSPSMIDPDAESRLQPIEMNTSTATATAEDEERQIENRQTEENGDDENAKKSYSLVEASAETRIQALKLKIVDMEARQNSELKCLICLSPYVSPAVSIQCWHVYCEVCWLESLRSKKICPQCSVITTTQHLRRIYM